MRVGVVGLGKLGLPVALAIRDAGHYVAGWDANPERRRQLRTHDIPEADFEPYVRELLLPHSMWLLPVEEMCRWADLILVCVQTPHRPEFEGTLPLRKDPEDFDYTALRIAVGQIADAGTDALVVIVSTCLPGTFDRELRERCGQLRVAYHPLFIAMGSVIEDFRHPEFLLVGTDDEATPEGLVSMYAPVLAQSGHYGRIQCMSITSAELTKVAYNVAIGFKLLLANTIAELADKTDADCDAVMDTLKLADRRITSGAYFTPGMGDGGACHPRDQIALSWLSGAAHLSHDPFGYVVAAREIHAEWLVDRWVEGHDLARAVNGPGVPMIMLGEAYKPNTNLKTGSHASLVAYYARQRFAITITDTPLEEYPVACYFLATPHHYFLSAPLPPGSVVVDPWGLYREPVGVGVVRPGRRARA